MKSNKTIRVETNCKRTWDIDYNHGTSFHDKESFIKQLCNANEDTNNIIDELVLKRKEHNYNRFKDYIETIAPDEYNSCNGDTIYAYFSDCMYDFHIRDTISEYIYLDVDIEMNFSEYITDKNCIGAFELPCTITLEDDLCNKDQFKITFNTITGLLTGDCKHFTDGWDSYGICSLLYDGESEDLFTAIAEEIEETVNRI